jgi:hypothetical protein
MTTAEQTALEQDIVEAAALARAWEDAKKRVIRTAIQDLVHAHLYVEVNEKESDKEYGYRLINDQVILLNSLLSIDLPLELYWGENGDRS